MKQNEIIIKKHPLKQIGLLLACAIFVWIGIEMVTSDFRSSRISPETAKIMGIIGLIFFGLGGLLILYNFLTSKSALIINSSGIMNNSHFGGAYLIRWENIESLELISFNKQKMIEIQLRDHEEVYKQVNGIVRRWMKMNCRYMGTPAFIPAVMIKMKLEDVLKIIREQKKLSIKA